MHTLRKIGHSYLANLEERISVSEQGEMNSISFLKCLKKRPLTTINSDINVEWRDKKKVAKLKLVSYSGWAKGACAKVAGLELLS